MRRRKMSLVNRSAFTVRRRQPYLDWAARTPPDRVAGSAKDLDRVATVYLFPVPVGPGEADALVERCMITIFAAELHDWTSDMSRWPTPPPIGAFHEWFEMDYADSVFDLGTGRIVGEGS